MQNSAYLQMLDEITAIDKKQKHIQILFSGSPALGHWICTYYDSKNRYVYDSLNAKCLNEDQEKFLKMLYPFQPKPLFPNVQQQPYLIDCGTYAIAFATSIYFGTMPDTVLYNHTLMRQHLYAMFKRNCLLPFPIISRTNNCSIAIYHSSNDFKEIGYQSRRRKPNVSIVESLQGVKK